jgi:signal transduction protein with GAF and PtsI domain
LTIAPSQAGRQLTDRSAIWSSANSTGNCQLTLLRQAPHRTITEGCSLSDRATQSSEPSDIDLLHEIGSRMAAAADPFHTVLERIIELVTDAVRCDSCFIYVLDKNQLVLRASKNPHSDEVDHLVLALGQGITGWVASNKQAVAIPAKAWSDPRFAKLGNLPEDRFEAFLSVPILCRGKLVGVINIQHRQPHHHTQREIRLITMLGYLVGAEVELARIEYEKAQLSDQLETRKVMERAKGILQRELSLDEEAAYLTLQKQSRQRRKPLREIAEAIILMDDLRRTKP